eukprot:2065831-Amphidinium_carterae.1
MVRLHIQGLGVRRSQSDLNLSGHMGSCQKIDNVTAIQCGSTQECLGTPSDPSAKLQEFEEEFIGFPLLMA